MKTVPVLVLGVMAILATACSHQAVPTAVAPGTVSAQVAAMAGTTPANPVPILRETGVDMATQMGAATDIYSDRFDCAWYHGDGDGIGTGEEVCVDTYRDYSGQAADLTRNAAPSDGSKPVLLAHPAATVWVTPVQDADGNFTFPVSLATIAGLVHGQLEASK